MIKKILGLLILSLFITPCFAIEIYNDNNYSFQVDSVMFFENGNKIYYTLYVLPLLDNSKYYKAQVTQYKTNGYLNISKLYTLSPNEQYVHTDNSKNIISNTIKNYNTTLSNNILNTFTNCEENISYLYCLPNR